MRTALGYRHMQHAHGMRHIQNAHGDFAVLDLVDIL